MAFSEKCPVLLDEDGESGGDLNVENMRKKDDLYESAIQVVIREGRESLSLIQRCLGIGYDRAARLVDYMAEDGIVGQYKGSKSRDVLLTMEQWNAMQGIEPEADKEHVQFSAAIQHMQKKRGRSHLAIDLSIILR